MPELPSDTLHAHLLRHVDVAGSRVVDVGCGSGELVRWLRGQGADVVGVECGATMIGLARAADAAHADTYIDATAQALPLPDGEADVVVMANSLHHVPADAMDTALAEACRVLRPGGILYASEPIAQGSGHELVAIIDDETEVRALAQDALDRSTGRGFDLLSDTAYAGSTVIASAESYGQRIVGIDPRRAQRWAEARSEFAAAYERLGVAVDDGRRFEMRTRARVLRKR
ncbi:MAG: class I SAM-dependent methyltransferase [Acidimicrobiia bacterium]